MVRAPWRERIIQARTRGRFTEQDRLDAESWPTCKVGEEHSTHPELELLGISPRGGLGCYWDELANLGGHFNFAVQADFVDAAEKLLDRIEDLVLVRKRELA
jgi:hypothetical protein